MVAVDTVRCLRVLADRDPGVLLRVLVRFSNLNLIPNRFNAVCGPSDQIIIEIDVTDIPAPTCILIAAKVAQLPAVLDARLDGVLANIIEAK
jgi:hypothetical protein